MVGPSELTNRAKPTRLTPPEEAGAFRSGRNPYVPRKENAVDENTDQDKHVERVLVHDFEVNELEWSGRNRVRLRGEVEVEGWS